HFLQFARVARLDRVTIGTTCSRVGFRSIGRAWRAPVGAPRELQPAADRHLRQQRRCRGTQRQRSSQATQPLTPRLLPSAPFVLSEVRRLLAKFHDPSKAAGGRYFAVADASLDRTGECLVGA